MTKKKLTPKQEKYFGKGHGKVAKGGKKSVKKGSKKMPMVDGKPAWLAKKKKK